MSSKSVFGKLLGGPWPLYARVLIGAVLGIALGEAFGSRPVAFGVGTPALGAAGMLVIRVLKALATPLIFFAVIDALLRSSISGRKGIRLVVLSCVNAIVAIGLGLGVAHILDSGTGAFAGVLSDVSSALDPVIADTPSDPGAGLTASIPENLVDPFRNNSVVTVVVLALLVGLALKSARKYGGEEEKAGVAVVAAGIHGAFRACTRLLGWVIETVPFAVACVIAHVVGKHGFSALGSLGTFLGTILLGLSLHVFVYYGFLLRVVGGASLRKFWKGAADAVITAMSCGSSLATLPVTLRCLKTMKVSTSSARLAACVGTNLNHDGIILYEAAATIFVAQALGTDLSLGAELGVAAAAVMAGIGIAGVPEAGLITLPLVLAAGGIPASVAPLVVPLLLPVDWLIGRLRAATNVASDMTVATLLDRLSPDDGAEASPRE